MSRDVTYSFLGKTILLLQIVYGAELQRLFAAADLAKNALNQVDTAQVHSDPQNFANAVGEAATRANQLAEYLRSKGINYFHEGLI